LEKTAAAKAALQAEPNSHIAQLKEQLEKIDADMARAAQHLKQVQDECAALGEQRCEVERNLAKATMDQEIALGVEGPCISAFCDAFLSFPEPGRYVGHDVECSFDPTKRQFVLTRTERRDDYNGLVGTRRLDDTLFSEALTQFQREIKGLHIVVQPNVLYRHMDGNVLRGVASSFGATLELLDC
jgi:hypothetical protein